MNAPVLDDKCVVIHYCSWLVVFLGNLGCFGWLFGITSGLALGCRFRCHDLIWGRGTQGAPW